MYSLKAAYSFFYVHHEEEHLTWTTAFLFIHMDPSLFFPQMAILFGIFGGISAHN